MSKSFTDLVREMNRLEEERQKQKLDAPVLKEYPKATEPIPTKTRK